MKRILFVDDEQQVLDALRDSLRKQRRDWHMVFARGGTAALEQMARSAPFDVVVSDMRMPEMDGAELLRRVKELYPSTTRIVLSGQAEQEMVVRALPISHQYLSKPCRAETLLQVVERVCALRTLLPDPSMQKLVGDLDTLPSAPASYHELMRVLAKPNTSHAEICRIVECDAALHAKVLQLANSAFFGLPQRVGSAQSAIKFLGLELIKALAVANHVFSEALVMPALPGFSLEELQTDALLVAELAKQLAPDSQHGEQAFTAGFLRDVGQMVLALRAREPFAQALRQAAERGCPLHKVEKELLGSSHAEVGAFLLGTWGLPPAIVAAVAHHHAPEPADPADGVTLPVQLGEMLMVEARAGGGKPAVQARAGAGVRTSRPEGSELDAFGSPAQVKRWRELAEQTLRRRMKK